MAVSRKTSSSKVGPRAASHHSSGGGKAERAGSAGPTLLKRDSAYETLLLDIICGVLRPGEAVDELSVAQRYELPRAGVREALSRLAHEGLVARRPRLGSVVAELGMIELQQIFDLRVQLESRAAALAASNATAADVARIRAAYADAGRALREANFREIIRMDLAFHEAVGQATHNRWLSLVTNTLNTNALRFWHYALARRPIDTLKREIDAHLRIADAIAAGDVEEAQAAMRDVLGEFPATVKGVFDDALFQPAQPSPSSSPRRSSATTRERKTKKAEKTSR